MLPSNKAEITIVHTSFPYHWLTLHDTRADNYAMDSFWSHSFLQCLFIVKTQISRHEIFAKFFVTGSICDIAEYTYVCTDVCVCCFVNLNANSEIVIYRIRKLTRIYSAANKTSFTVLRVFLWQHASGYRPLVT